MKKLAVIITLLSLAAGTQVQAGSEGTAGADFLKIGLGARAAGMGEAMTSVANGIDSIYWNPGALYRINDKEATFMHLSYFEGIRLNHAAYAQKVGHHAALGVLFEMLDMGDIAKTGIDSLGNLVDAGTSFEVRNIAAGLSYSQSLNEKHGLGVVVKFIQGKMEDETATAYALDLGWIYDVMENLHLGLALQNAGTKIKFVSAKDKLPLRIRAGLGFKPVKQLTLSTDAVGDINEEQISANIGLEYELAQVASLRLGYNTERIHGLNDVAGLGAGAGFKISNYRLDYGFVPYGDLGSSHRISLSTVY